MKNLAGLILALTAIVFVSVESQYFPHYCWQEFLCDGLGLIGITLGLTFAEGKS